MKTVTLGFIRSRDLSLAYNTSKYQYYYDAENEKMYKIKRRYVLKAMFDEIPEADENDNYYFPNPKFDW